MGCAHNMYVEMRNAYKVLVGKSETGDILQDQGIEGVRHLSASLRRREHSDWIDLLQDTDRE